MWSLGDGRSGNVSISNLSFFNRVNKVRILFMSSLQVVVGQIITVFVTYLLFNRGGR